MSLITLQTACDTFMVMLATDAAPATFPSSKPQLLSPLQDGTSTGVIDNSNAQSAQTLRNYGKFIFYGKGSAGNTFDAKIVGWSQVKSRSNSQVSMWIPQTIAVLLCTLGSTAGPTGGNPIDDTYLMVDAITVDSAVASNDVIPDDAQIGIATFRCDLSGFQLLQLQIGTPDSGTPASVANGLVSGF